MTRQQRRHDNRLIAKAKRSLKRETDRSLRRVNLQLRRKPAPAKPAETLRSHIHPRHKR